MADTETLAKSMFERDALERWSLVLHRTEERCTLMTLLRARLALYRVKV